MHSCSHSGVEVQTWESLAFIDYPVSLNLWTLGAGRDHVLKTKVDCNGRRCLMSISDLHVHVQCMCMHLLKHMHTYINKYKIKLSKSRSGKDRKISLPHRKIAGKGKTDRERKRRRTGVPENRRVRKATVTCSPGLGWWIEYTGCLEEVSRTGDSQASLSKELLPKLERK